MTPNNDDFKPCPSRQKMVHFVADGTQEPLFRCTESKAEHAHQNVAPDDCSACPLRVDLVKRIVKASPLKIIGKQTDAGSPGFLDCSDRLVVLVPGCCGAENRRWVCNSLDSPHYDQEVMPVICQKCTVRRTDAPPSS